MNFKEFVRGFKENMARNLVQEDKEDKEEKAEDKVAAKKLEDSKAPEEKIVYITTEQVILNNLNVIMTGQAELYNKVIEGFKAVGVKFEDLKEK